MKCLILAGGFATRLYRLTMNRAKALLKYRGKPVIRHIVSREPRDVDIMVSTNRKFEAEFAEWRRTLDRSVEICIEDAVSDDQKTGAVGAIDHWIKHKNINAVAPMSIMFGSRVLPMTAMIAGAKATRTGIAMTSP